LHPPRGRQVARTPDAGRGAGAPAVPADPPPEAQRGGGDPGGTRRAVIVLDGEIDAAAAAVALDDLRALDLQRHAHEPLLERVWDLRKNLTAYDAVYM